MKLRIFKFIFVLILDFTYCQDTETHIGSIPHYEYPFYQGPTINNVKKHHHGGERHEPESPLYNDEIKILSNAVKHLESILSQNFVLPAMDTRREVGALYTYSDPIQPFDPDLQPRKELLRKVIFKKPDSAQSTIPKYYKELFPLLFESDETTSSNPAQLLVSEEILKTHSVKIDPSFSSDRKPSNEYNYSKSSKPNKDDSSETSEEIIIIKPPNNSPKEHGHFNRDFSSKLEVIKKKLLKTEKDKTESLYQNTTLATNSTSSIERLDSSTKSTLFTEPISYFQFRANLFNESTSPIEQISSTASVSTTELVLSPKLTLSTETPSSIEPVVPTEPLPFNKTASFLDVTSSVTNSSGSSAEVTLTTNPDSLIEGSSLSTIPALPNEPISSYISSSSTEPDLSFQPLSSTQRATSETESLQPSDSSVESMELLANPISTTVSILYLSFEEPVYAQGTSLKYSNECEVGTTWVMNCYSCKCPDGKANCTRIEKDCEPPPIDEPKACKPYTEFSLDPCNKCSCDADGVPSCTVKICKKDNVVKERAWKQMYTKPVPTNKIVPETRPQKSRILSKLMKCRRPGKKKKKCRLIINVTTIDMPENKLMSKQNCPSAFVRFPRCKTGSSWKANCFECKCIKSQPNCKRIQVCQPPIYGAPTVCQPGSHILDSNCTSCECNDDGQKVCSGCRKDNNDLT